ncbi:MAG: general secretion pathway protein GspB [Pseudomonadota bacterium]
MSLILDALNKAEAERHAGQTRKHLPEGDSHSVASSSIARQSHWRKCWAKWLLSIVFTILAAAGIVWWTQVVRIVPVTDSKSLGSVKPFAEPTTKLTTKPTTEPMTEPRLPAISAPISETVGRAVPAPETVITTSQLPVPAPIARLPSAVTLPDSTPLVAKPQTMKLSQLPTQVRSEVPPVAISGSIYSSDPKERLLLVDKRMLREGDEIAPGLILERILQKGAVLRYKGHVFEVGN